MNNVIGQKEMHRRKTIEDFKTQMRNNPILTENIDKHGLHEGIRLTLQYYDKKLKKAYLGLYFFEALYYISIGFFGYLVYLTARDIMEILK